MTEMVSMGMIQHELNNITTVIVKPIRSFGNLLREALALR